MIESNLHSKLSEHHWIHCHVEPVDENHTKIFFKNLEQDH